MPEQIQIFDPPSLTELNNASERLFGFKALFPFDFFPDEVVLDRFKIVVIKRDFFLSQRVMTIPISGTIGVKVNSGPIFSQIEIFDPAGGQKTVIIEKVLNNHARRFRTLVEGLIVAIRQGINVNEMSKNDMIKSAQLGGDY
jgi:hypothetical protein